MQTLLPEIHPTPVATSVVTASDVVRRYGDGDTAVDALRGVSVDIARGQLTAVMGPSGSCKSTLMHILAGLDQPTAGDVTVAGVDLTALDDTALTLAGRRPDKEWLDRLIDSVGLADRLTHRPSELSGGQQQRVAVARALICTPTVLFADEPTGNLDSAAGAGVLDLLRTAVDEDGQTTVMVTHDAHAAAIADRVLFLADGCIVKELRGADAGQILSAMEEVSRR